MLYTTMEGNEFLQLRIGVSLDQDKDENHEKIDQDEEIIYSQYSNVDVV